MNIPWLIKFMTSHIRRETTIVERKRGNIAAEPFILILKVLNLPLKSSTEPKGRHVLGGAGLPTLCSWLEEAGLGWSVLRGQLGQWKGQSSVCMSPSRELPEPHCHGAGHPLPWDGVYVCARLWPLPSGAFSTAAGWESVSWWPRMCPNIGSSSVSHHPLTFLPSRADFSLAFLLSRADLSLFLSFFKGRHFLFPLFFQGQAFHFASLSSRTDFSLFRSSFKDRLFLFPFLLQGQTFPLAVSPWLCWVPLWLPFLKLELRPISVHKEVIQGHREPHRKEWKSQCLNQ